MARVLDPITLDQLRAFVAAVEEGSFSAAGRKLKRAQSAISASMANLEQQLGMPLWDRSSRVPRLTAQGSAMLAAVQRVLLDVEALKRVTAGMVSGLEPVVSLCVEAVFPLSALVDVCSRFAAEMPSVDLRIDTQSLSDVSARVLSGAASLGVGVAPGLTPELARTPLGTIEMLPTVAPTHPLAKHRGIVPLSMLADAVQIVLSERNEAGVPDRGVFSPRTWRVADLHTKRAMLRAGLGWGSLPDHMARDDFRARKRVAIRPEPWSEATKTLFAIHRNDRTLGPAHRWLVATLASVLQRTSRRSAKRVRSV